MKHQHLTASLLGFSTIIAGLSLISNKVEANSAIDYVAISVPVSCSMSSIIENGEEHTAELQNGIYRDEIGVTNITTYCNDGEGFSLYAVGYTNEEYGNTLLIGNGLNSNFNIATGTARDGGTSNWAMKLLVDAGSANLITIDNGFSSYSAVPSTYTKVAYAESNTDTSVQGISVSTTYAAYINSTQPAGTYTGKVKYTLVHPFLEIPAQPQSTAPGYIGYYSNTNVSEGNMGLQPLSSSDTTATLLASNYSRSGYGFAGWNTAYDYSGDFYGPNETISFEAGQYTNGETGLSLYAVWVESDGLIQDWHGCDMLSPASYDETTGTLTAGLPSITALTDLRDNQTYAVARLADGKCWTIENLRLSSEYTEGESAGTLSQGFGHSDNYGNFIGLADSENSNFLDTSTSNNIYGINSSSLVNIGAIDSPSFRLPRYNSTNTTSRSSNPNTSNAFFYGYGNYYNWPAAMASTKKYTSGYIDNDQESSQSNLANTSLCPSGWRMPYGSNAENIPYSGDLASLDQAMGGNGSSNSLNNTLNISMSYYWRKFPNNLVYSGIANGSSIDSRGSEGYLWTTTAFDEEKSYGSSINDAYINPGVDSYKKYYGLSVRCLSSN